MPPKGAKSRSTKKSQKNKAKAKGKTKAKAKAKANAENKGPQIKEVELFEDLLEEPEVQGPDFHLMGEDISIWDLQSIVDLWHGTKIHIPILKSDPEGNKELQEEVTLGKIPGCQLHGFEIIRDGLVDADGKVIGAFAVPEYISHSAAKRAWDYIRNKYPYQKVLFPVPDDRFSDRTFRVHMPVVIVDGTLDDPPHDFSWRCPPNMLDDGAFYLHEMSVTQGALDTLHERLGEQRSRNVLSDHERVRYVLSLLFLYPDHDCETEDGEIEETESE
ncbi:hypothetical protein EG327_008235 [Venturia inaequalis]|uniref:Uncharacterized protein n=1 Tax=Venturia inaequalis TaxID=5025 RepID=A0A8H3YXZ8_VENIN|nr:hypothetical protein EG327_008235 [Venturia inaequalis]